ncbi:hypothetical protein [Segnochrobactrum spirostomi]|uniref:hypothetical protein n=1 Tax=Segnochrobactrum spirostomi TaxID=2608987 RepID=UPI0012956DD4|nr:hypothetical protein [Segnochrobactrum spirostomi]
MAPLELSEPAADTPRPARSFADLVAAKDWTQVAALCEGAADTANGDVKLGPANAGGGL